MAREVFKKKAKNTWDIFSPVKRLFYRSPLITTIPYMVMVGCICVIWDYAGVPLSVSGTTSLYISLGVFGYFGVLFGVSINTYNQLRSKFMAMMSAVGGLAILFKSTQEPSATYELKIIESMAYYLKNRVRKTYSSSKHKKKFDSVSGSKVDTVDIDNIWSMYPISLLNRASLLERKTTGFYRSVFDSLSSIKGSLDDIETIGATGVPYYVKEFVYVGSLVYFVFLPATLLPVFGLTMSIIVAVIAVYLLMGPVMIAMNLYSVFLEGNDKLNADSISFVTKSTANGISYLLGETEQV